MTDGISVVLEVWLPGEEGGGAVGKVLLGDAKSRW